MTTRPKYHGQCHCGAIGFTYSTEESPDRWSIRACQCTFCRAHDALSASAPEAEIQFFAKDENRLQKYRFGLHTADFLICRTCGVYIGAVIEIDGAHYGIINTHALTPEPEDMASVSPINYDQEDTADRVSRRQDRWARVSELP